MVNEEDKGEAFDPYDQIFEKKRQERERAKQKEAKETQRREAEREAGEAVLRDIVLPRLQHHADRLHDRHDGIFRWLLRARIQKVPGIGMPNTIRATLVVDRQPDGGPKPEKAHLSFHHTAGKIIGQTSSGMPPGLRTQARVDGIDEAYIDEVVVSFVRSIHDAGQQP